MNTQAGFLNFIRTIMAIPVGNLPDSSPYIAYAYNVALAIVNQQLSLVGVPNTGAPGLTMYDLAVYNLAGDNLINYAIDPLNAVPVATLPDGQQVTYFDNLRYRYGIGSFQGGVVSSVSDVSTSTSLEVIKAAANFTLSDLQNLKTPYGRQYLAIAMRFGALWGLT